MLLTALAGWVGRVARAPRLTLALLGMATALCAWVSVERFQINSDLSTLIRQDADWRRDFDHFRAQFPDLAQTAVVVVSSDSIKALENATREVVDYLEAHPEFYAAVAAPGSDRFFRDHAFLYLDPDELDDMADRLAAAQPWLSAVARAPGLVGMLDLVEDGLRSEPPEDFERVLTLLADSLERSVAGEDGTIRWADELFPSDTARRQLVYLKANSDYGETLPDARVIAELRNGLAALDLDASVDVRLTGEIALQHEEIEAAIEGVTLAGWLALGLLLLVLVVGVRSGKIVAATFLLLGVGVVWTSAYAMLAVGEYNTLSLVFVVMFFGLGVDFALHFSLRYQEAVNQGERTVPEALMHSTTSVGRAISLCTLTTAIGFLGFWPTDYAGLAHLGVISAGGMVVAWFLTFTLLPAFFALVGPPRPHTIDLPTGDSLVRWLSNHRRIVLLVTAVGGIGAGALALQTRFDYSVLALKDPESESMSTLRLLQDEGISTDYSLVVVDPAGVNRSALEALPVVREVITPEDLVPEAQADKLIVVEDVRAMLWDVLEPSSASLPPPGAVRRRAETLAAALPSDDGLAKDRLADALLGIARAPEATIERAQRAATVELLAELEWLRRAMAVEAIEFADLPAATRARVLSATGERLSAIVPAEDTAPVEALSRFITEVRAVEPNATGRPVVEWGVGGIVVGAFQQALVFAAVGIGIVLLVTLRSFATAAMVLVPLALAALCALAAGVLLDMPINMANILVLPLVFGLGVDNGIHVVERYLGEGDVEHLIHSSTPRAVMLSALTTIGAFASLTLSPHQGTASIGALLTIAVSLLLVFTIVLLPVMLAGRRARHA